MATRIGLSGSRDVVVHEDMEQVIFALNAPRASEVWLTFEDREIGEVRVNPAHIVYVNQLPDPETTSDLANA